ncbi:polysaccharide deacetylase family protein [Bradyrhizobium prioriisuperbiae]|uniref:polysaccharide deacetylase family protein n=1 Tax=Bradyrhizobium prioriisuperbiae TaxID=2854389 RepID=UPI0028ECA69C|nr:polysaccharide deacetylase family protein [Bradyrhizobium prioritasuperba]
MINFVSVGHRARPLSVLASAFGLALLATSLLVPTAARADGCPGNPGALGTSRTLVIDPTEHTKVGTMQYSETLPLKDHEVVLTFDDGPLPPHSNQVLETLASECVKATFFIIGRMAHQFPDGVRRVRDAGHTIGTHSENHPLSFNRMPVERAMQEINDGIEHTAAALGDRSAIAPFFRIPGLLRAEGVEEYLASQGIMTWSADFPADDWRHISSAQVLHLALTRLEAKGKGILLLHDIQGRTSAMLPTLLRELKARGYKIVHVVPATPDRPKTPTEPRDWLLHPDAAPAAAVASWPAVPRFVYTQTGAMVAPGLEDTRYADDMTVFHRPRDRVFRPGRFAADTVPLPPEPLWPRSALKAVSPVNDLPAPDRSVFRAPPMPRAELKLMARHGTQHAQQSPSAKVDTAVETTGSIRVQPTTGHQQLPGSWPVTPIGLHRGPLTLR